MLLFDWTDRIGHADYYLAAGRVVEPDGFRTVLVDPLREAPVSDSEVLSRASFGTLPLDPDAVRPLKQQIQQRHVTRINSLQR